MHNIINRIIKRVFVFTKIGLISIFSIFKRSKAEDQILIFSDPRGGSTWLTEIIKSIPGTAIIWEPLHLSYVHQLSDLNFGWRQYIPEGIEWPQAEILFEKILKGKIINEWTMLYSSLSNYLSANTFIIKFCRGNMLLPWITGTFNLKYQPIYMVRHPFAVVNSQLKQGGWNKISNSFEIPNTPYNDCFNIHSAFLKTLTTKEERLTAVWCITNNIPLNHPNNNSKWITVYYERLLLHPNHEIQRIFNTWNIPVPKDIEITYQKKSSTTKGEMNSNDPEIQLAKWQRELTELQLNKMQRVLDYFEITCYSRDKLTPGIDNKA